MAGRHVARRGGGRRWALTIGVLLVVVAAAVVVVTRTGGVSLVSGGPPRCSGRPIDLTVASSPDKAALLSDLAKAYTATGPVVRNRCVKVNVTSQEPAIVGQALAAGWDPAVNGEEPDVWAPSSSSWLYLLAGLPNGRVLLEGPRRSIARSPVVIAMPRPMAEAIGWPDKTLGWAELLGLARDPAGWGKLKHPEWGPFKLGLTPPDRSTAGLQSVLALQAALTDRGRTDPTVAAAAQAKGDQAAAEALQQIVLGGMVQFERAVAHYADTTDALLQQLRQADEQDKTLDFLSAFPAEEQAIWAYNHGAIGDEAGEGKGTKPKVQLAAVYPTEGAPEADHPYVVLNTPRVDRDRQAAATDFLRYLREEPAQQRFLRVGYRGIDSNRGFIGTEEDGLLTGQPSPALQAPKAEDVGRTVKTWAALGQRGVVLSVMDVSGSMKAIVPGTGKTKLQIAVEATGFALGLFGRDSEVGLWEFSRQIDGDKDWRELVPIGPMNEAVNGVSRREALARAHQSMRPRGDTGLYDTTLAGYKALKAKWQPDRINALVLVTDGINDDPGSLTLAQLISRLKAEQDPQRPIAIIAIAYGADADLDVLKQIAAVAPGGAAYASKDPRDIGKVFLQALTSAQQQPPPEP